MGEWVLPDFLTSSGGTFWKPKRWDSSYLCYCSVYDLCRFKQISKKYRNQLKNKESSLRQDLQNNFLIIVYVPHGSCFSATDILAQILSTVFPGQLDGNICTTRSQNKICSFFSFFCFSRLLENVMEVPFSELIFLKTYLVSQILLAFVPSLVIHQSVPVEMRRPLVEVELCCCQHHAAPCGS